VRIQTITGGNPKCAFIGNKEEHFVLVVGNRPARKKFFVVINGICISGEIPGA